MRESARIEIPAFRTLYIEHIVCDYNGTIAFDGRVSEGTRKMLQELAERFSLHVVTADTFGSASRELEGLDLRLHILESSDHTHEKGALVDRLGADRCVAIGNGRNDRLMLHKAVLGIAVMAEEGCAASTLAGAEILCRSGEEALGLLLHPKRLVATLRQ